MEEEKTQEQKKGPTLDARLASVDTKEERPQIGPANELYEIETEDIEQLEERLAQIEKYIGIEQMDPDELLSALKNN